LSEQAETRPRPTFDFEAEHGAAPAARAHQPVDERVARRRRPVSPVSAVAGLAVVWWFEGDGALDPAGP